MGISQIFYKKKRANCPICGRIIWSNEKRRILQGRKKWGRLYHCNKCKKDYLKIKKFQNKWMDNLIHSLIFYRINNGKIMNIDKLKERFPKESFENLSYKQIFKKFIIEGK